MQGNVDAGKAAENFTRYSFGVHFAEVKVDPNLGRIVNHDLAEYHVPVNADIPDIDAFFIEEHDDRVNPLGVKGIGEIGTVSAAAAIYHATGRRIRDLPITPDKLL